LAMRCTEEEIVGGADFEVLSRLITVSRRYWGPWTSPLRWRCEASFHRYLGDAHERARHHARAAEHALAEGRPIEARLEMLNTWCHSPAMARGRFGRR
jgi:hypothetical protein